jgi:hypothetical protein
MPLSMKFTVPIQINVNSGTIKSLPNLLQAARLPRLAETQGKGTIRIWNSVWKRGTEML